MLEKLPFIRILTSGGTVKVDDNLEIVLRCPADSPEEVVVLSLDIRFARTYFVGPITYRDAYVIESKRRISVRREVPMLHIRHAPSTCDCLKVGLGDERIPMLHQL